MEAKPATLWTVDPPISRPAVYESPGRWPPEPFVSSSTSENEAMRLAARVTSVADLTPPQRDAMFLLMERHYENVHRAVFEADLAEKKWVILVSDPLGDRLCGFSTQGVRDVHVAGRPVKALFSGDTIISREHWG